MTPPDEPLQWPRKDAPSYKQYRTVYIACQILCMDRFSPAIIDRLFEETFTPQICRNVILGKLADCTPFDIMVAEGVSRLLCLSMDRGYTAKMLLSFGNYQLEFLEGKLQK